MRTSVALQNLILVLVVVAGTALYCRQVSPCEPGPHPTETRQASSPAAVVKSAAAVGVAAVPSNAPTCAHLLGELARTVPATIRVTTLSLDTLKGTVTFDGYPEGKRPLEYIAATMRHLQNAHCFLDATLCSGGCSIRSSGRRYEFGLESHFHPNTGPLPNLVGSPFAEMATRRELACACIEWHVETAPQIVQLICAQTSHSTSEVKCVTTNTRLDPESHRCQFVFPANYQQAICFFGSISPDSPVRIEKITMVPQAALHASSPELKVTVVLKVRPGPIDPE